MHAGDAGLHGLRVGGHTAFLVGEQHGAEENGAGQRDAGEDQVKRLAARLPAAPKQHDNGDGHG